VQRSTLVTQIFQKYLSGFEFGDCLKIARMRSYQTQTLAKQKHELINAQL